MKRIYVDAGPGHPRTGEGLYLPHELREIERMRKELPEDEFKAVLGLIHEAKVCDEGATLLPPTPEELTARRERDAERMAKQQETML